MNTLSKKKMVNKWFELNKKLTSTIFFKCAPEIISLNFEVSGVLKQIKEILFLFFVNIQKFTQIIKLQIKKLKAMKCEI
jgi:hypothetical protein